MSQSQDPSGVITAFVDTYFKAIYVAAGSTAHRSQLGAIYDVLVATEHLSEGEQKEAVVQVISLVAGSLAGALVTAILGASLPALLAAGAIGYMTSSGWKDLMEKMLRDAGEENLDPWVKSFLEKGYFDWGNQCIADPMMSPARGLWMQAVSWRSQRDPLALDLDGDGIETYGQSDALLFDHSGSNLVNGTGWVKPDDGFLAYDRNGNGLIDNGSELFGVDTVMSNGHKANSGFQALKDFDANNDGKIDSSDAIYSSLRVWQDANGNAVTDAGELKTLAELQIASINVNPTGGTVNLGNGNTTSGSAAFTLTNGTIRTAYNLDLAVNTYQREYKDDLPTPALLADLPNMSGTGRVRDLLQAAIRDDDLADLVEEFSEGTTRAEQMAVVDSLIAAWANTSDMKTSVQDMQDRKMPSISGSGSTGEALLIYNIAGVTVGKPYTGISYNSSTGGSETNALADYFMALRFGQNPAYQAWLEKIAILERFNGQTFFNVPAVQVQTKVVNVSNNSVDPDDPKFGNSASFSFNYLEINISQGQKDLLERSYNELKDSVYGALALQTRLKPYLDAIDLDITGSSLSLDFSGISDLLTDYRSDDALNAYIDLVDINRYAGRNLYQQGWTGAEILYDWLQQPLSTEIQAAMAALGVRTTFGSQTGTISNEFIFGGASVDTIYAGEGNDIISLHDGNDYVSADNGSDIAFGGNGNDNLDMGAGDDLVYGDAGYDTLKAGAGNDVIYGGSEGDTIYDGTGNDVIDAGTGNDFLYGDAGDDVYIFGAGDGQDSLRFDGVNGLKTLQFKEGVNPGDIRIDRSDTSMKLVNTITGDSIQVINHFGVSAGLSASYENQRLDRIEFSDGTVWTYDDTVTMYQSLHTTSGNDELLGFAWDEVRYMGAGNDYVTGVDGNDELHGEDGNDRLRGENGNDVLYGDAGVDTVEGGAGNDLLYGGSETDYLYDGAGNDVIDAGTGNDVIYGDAGDDVYIFGAGDGQDSLRIDGTNGLKTLQFKAGINPGDIRVDRSDTGMKLVNTITGDSILVINHFGTSIGQPSLYENQRLDRVEFSNGTVWTYEDTIALYVTHHATSGNDELLGFSGDEVRYVGAGNDYVTGFDGNDELHGEDGNDRLRGENGNDVLYGDAGVDTVEGGAGNDLLYGGSETDYLYDGAGNDVIDAGTGNDVIYGDAGDDVYIFGAGDGQDSLRIDGTNGLKTLQFKAGVNPGDIRIDRSTTTMKLVNTITGDSISVNNHFGASAGQSSAYENQRVDRIEFSDGTVWTYEDTVTLYGTHHATSGNDESLGFSGDEVRYVGAGNDYVTGFDGNDELYGEDGSDTLYGDNGNDFLYGGTGNDALYGGSGNDVLDGGEGNDNLSGGAGNDIYRFASGSGIDTLSDSDGSSGQDQILYGSGVAYDQLWLRHVGNNLEISVIGTSDKVTISSWYGGTAYHVEKIQMADGHYLLDSQVEQLVQAMAGMTVPALGQTDLSTGQRQQLDSVFASSWQAA